MTALRSITSIEVDMPGVTSFVCSMYGFTTSYINEARYKAFIRMSRCDEKDPLATIKKINCTSLPPCNKTLGNHVKRAQVVSMNLEESQSDGSNWRGKTHRIRMEREQQPVAYSGVFSGCPETPPPGHDFFYNQVGDTLTGTDLHQPLQFATFGNPPDTNPGYATDNRLEPDRFPGRSVPETLGATRRDDATTRMDDAASHIGDVSTHADDERTERMTLVTTLTTWEWWRQHPRTTNSRVPGERTAMTVPTKIRRATFEDVKTYKHTSIKHTTS